MGGSNLLAYVDSTRCIGCGACVDVCPVQALRLVNGLAEVDSTRCTACEACADTCPQHAISMVGAPAAVESAALVPETVDGSARVISVPRPTHGMRPWLGAALAFVAREVVPRVATSLLDAWDRRRASVAPADGLIANLPPMPRESSADAPGGRAHQHRWQHGRR